MAYRVGCLPCLRPTRPQPKLASAETRAAVPGSPPPATEEEEHDEGPTCRICWCEADSRHGGKLVCPCHCAGSIAHVHQRCLHQWIARGPGLQHPRCEVCRARLRGLSAAVVWKGRAAATAHVAGCTLGWTMAAVVGLPALAVIGGGVGAYWCLETAVVKGLEAVDPGWWRRRKERRRTEQEIAAIAVGLGRRPLQALEPAEQQQVRAFMQQVRQQRRGNRRRQ